MLSREAAIIPPTTSPEPVVKKATPKQSTANVDKSSAKTTRSTGKPFVKGDPRIQRGRGPKKGAPNAGRPPNAWKARMEALRDRWLAAAEAAEVVDDPDHPLFAPLGKFLHEAVAGKPAAAVDVTSNGKELKALTWTFGGREVTF